MSHSAVPAFPVYLGIDVGTQSVKTVLYSMNATGGRVVHATGFSNPIPINNLDNGYIEQNPSDWIVALHESVAKTFEGRWNMVSLLAAIGVSGQQHGLVTVGSDDEIVRPCMLWCDTRAEKEAAELTDVSSCDAPIPAGFTGPKLLWLKRHEPENFHKTVKIMLPHDYINYYLSGCTVHVMERGDASGTGLLHSSGLYFDRELLEYIDATLHLKFPKTKLKSPNEMIGKVAPSVASTLFQSDHYQYIQTGKVIYLSPGSGDNAMSALGVGASVPGSSLVVSLGTSGTLFTCHSRRLTDASGVVAPFCDATGNWLPLTCIQNCGLVCEEIRVSISDSCAGVLSVNEITEVACRESIGCEGVVVIPYFSSGGERTPNWPHASGGMLGLRSGHLNRPGLLYRAALESICFALYRGYLKMQAIGLHSSFKELQVVGGGAENELWCQILADVFQLPVVHSAYADVSAAFGAALQAAAVHTGRSVGEYCASSTSIEELLTHTSTESDNIFVACTGKHRVYKPNVKHKDLYQQLYRRSTALCDTLFVNKSLLEMPEV